MFDRFECGAPDAKNKRRWGGREGEGLGGGATTAAVVVAVVVHRLTPGARIQFDRK